MGYISGIGTGFAALTLVSAASARADTPTGASVTLEVGGLRSTRGQILVCMTRDPKLLNHCERDPAAISARFPASQSSHRFDHVPPGTWAIALIHDENGNGRLDTMMGIPKEGFGFSRNPAIRFGPPAFADAAFALGTAAVTQSVRVKYML